MRKIKKYIAIGPESTGKSTLCRLLSEHYHTLWCPEYARSYLEANGADYEYNDLLEIAKGQLTTERRVAEQVREMPESDLLFIDTDMHVMRVWCEYVFDNCHQIILDEIADRECSGYFLCAPDLPWEADPLRELPDQHSRNELFLYYQEILLAQQAPWVVIKGSYDERTRKAISFVDDH